MFSGIVTHVGTVRAVEDFGGHCRVSIESADLDVSTWHLGDSIAVQGACMTAIELCAPSLFKIDISQASQLVLAKFWEPGCLVNLERSLRLGDAIHGHLLSGHVDGTAEVIDFQAVGQESCYRLGVRVPPALKPFFAYKGSVTIDGVSLTLNEVEDSEIYVNLVPHTLVHTTLRQLVCGQRVNIEVDMLARYVVSAVSGMMSGASNGLISE